ncbi:rRNA maturation RNase YbeY [Corynebacterium breve]|uniref:Endoribonuclease YbeY n=1 Tax=Corynebacterium breve TaxID=3049799 RepID=A0ABY8VBP9_9CORY|nr:rRNA maturation RNase YbeY [Corynebacterium breve]WIM67095.1 rRNA maturation RNase YbeY [Corynebacterium breve]
MSIEVLNESGYDGINEEMLVDVCSYALSAMDVHPDTEVTITLVDTDTMADLHVRWMDLEGPTDVMSFPMDELTPGGGRPDAASPGPAMLGDIILCPEFDDKQARAAGHPLGHELALLTVHGCLHLLGYDHTTPADEREMFALQNEILADWYDDLAGRDTEYQPKPAGKHAFPSAADRVELDGLVAKQEEGEN